MKIILVLDVGHFSERVSDLTWFSAFALCGSGRVLNRFSKDIGEVDLVLPWTFVDACQVLFRIRLPWTHLVLQSESSVQPHLLYKDIGMGK